LCAMDWNRWLTNYRFFCRRAETFWRAP
jgi:hypothetical protein